MLLLLLVILVGAAVVPAVLRYNAAEKEIVVQEALQCVSAVCVDDNRVGEECTYINPSVSKVLITVDPADTQKRIVRVEPTDAECR
tara:strand:+ start:57209 stop:57466 length:258 start_codon:yes stop_codon:yes gene_type:complete